MIFVRPLLTFLVTFTLLIAIVAQDEGCGTRIGKFGMMFGGNQTQKGEWPWIVAFFFQPGDRFFCGGSLISIKHVLSGECLPEKITGLCST